MTEPQVFRVLPRQVNETLAAALRTWLPDRSWSQISKLVRTRYVMISGNVCVDAGRRLKLEDVIKVLDRPAAAPPGQHHVLIRYLDQHVVVVEKPAGVTSIRHAEERDWPQRRKQIQPTLDELLPGVISRYESQGGHGGADSRRRPNQRKPQKGVPPPVRAVHRIDRETSGLMVFARSIRAERHLGEQFRAHTTHRRYLAVVPGQVIAQTISNRLIRDRGDGRRGSTTDPAIGKIATTHIRPLETRDDYTLIECRLETGRTHQIRIHMAEIGHPLCGEKVYRQPPGGKAIPDHSHAPRLALHAAEIGFTHPITGEIVKFDSPLPPDLQRFWQGLPRA